MQNVRWVFGLSMLGWIPIACDDSFSTAAVEGPALSEVPRLYAESLCKALNDCTPQTAEILLGPNDCTALMTKRVQEATLQLWQAAVRAGSMKFAPSKLQTCLNQLEALGCKALDHVYLLACEDALGGTVPIGGACTTGGECAGDAYCQYQAECPGICKTRELAGYDLCLKDDACQPGDKCVNGKCTQPVPEGASCALRPLGCASGFVCAPDAGNGRVCVAQADVFSLSNGADCDIRSAAWCAQGSYCAATALGLNGSTQTCVSQAASGAACNLSVADMCPPNEYCEGTAFTATTAQIEGTCHPLPGDGEACTNKGELGKACAAEHVCVTTEAGALCHQLQVNGRSCGVDADCYSESCVDAKCVPKADCHVKR